MVKLLDKQGPVSRVIGGSNGRSLGETQPIGQTDNAGQIAGGVLGVRSAGRLAEKDAITHLRINN